MPTENQHKPKLKHYHTGNKIHSVVTLVMIFLCVSPLLKMQVFTVDRYLQFDFESENLVNHEIVVKKVEYAKSTEHILLLYQKQSRLYLVHAQ